MNKFVVYTAILGNYDAINQPYALDERFDYILFSNDIKEKRIGVWQVRSIPYVNEDKTRIARWVKTHPEELLMEYELSLWMDGALVIKTDSVYRRVLELYGNGVVVSSMWHDQRDCIYDEAVEVVIKGLEHENVVVDWLRFLAKENYPKHNGLFETNVLYRNHKNHVVKDFDCLWWNCIDCYSRRDQLSFNYSLWKIGLRCPFFFGLKENARNSANILCVTDHVGINKKWREVIRDKKNDVLICNYSRFKKGQVNKSKLKHMYVSASNTFFPHMILKLYGSFYRWLNVMKIVRKKCIQGGK